MIASGLLTYHHMQKGPWGLLLYALIAAFLTASWFVPTGTASMPRLVRMTRGLRRTTVDRKAG